MKSFLLKFRNGIQKIVKAECAELCAHPDTLPVQQCYPFKSWDEMFDNLESATEIFFQVEVSSERLNGWAKTNYGGVTRDDALFEREKLCQKDEIWIAPKDLASRYRRTRVVEIA